VAAGLLLLLLMLLLLLLLLWQQAQVSSMGLVHQQRHTLSVTQRGQLCSNTQQPVCECTNKLAYWSTWHTLSVTQRRKLCSSTRQPDSMLMHIPSASQQCRHVV
jgi:hypothetical protein